METGSVRAHRTGTPLFDVAGGSVRGRTHDQSGRNNQDALAWCCTDDAIIAVVCDGCGSAQHSEFGAQLGAHLLLQTLRLWLPDLHRTPAGTILAHVRQQVLTPLHGIVRTMGGNHLHTIREYLLFTVVAAVITPQHALVFTLGDGVVAINGVVTSLRYDDNTPPYLAYGLIADKLDEALRAQLMFQAHYSGRSDNVHAILLGTDGVDTLHQHADTRLPGRDERVGPLAQFWRQDRYFTNPYSITRHLTRLNRSVMQPDWERRDLRRHEGLLADDTTLIVIRRKAGGAKDK